MKLKWWPCLQEESELRKLLKSLIKHLHNDTSLFPYLLFLIINSLQSFLPKKVVDSLFGRNASFFHADFPILPDMSCIEIIKAKNYTWGPNSEHPRCGLETSIIHHAVTLCLCYDVGYEATVFSVSGTRDLSEAFSCTQNLNNFWPRGKIRTTKSISLPIFLNIVLHCHTTQKEELTL